jgi:hypothetical protein
MAVRDEAIDATPQAKRLDNLLLALARDHLALLVPLIGVLIFVFRCFIVSGGDPYVAFILAAETSVGNAVRALLFTVLPILLLLLSLVVSFAAMMRIIVGRPPGLKTAGMGLGILAVGGVLSLGGWFLTGIFQQPLSSTAVAILVIVPPFFAAELAELVKVRRPPKRRQDRRLPKSLAWILKALTGLDRVFQLFISLLTVALAITFLFGLGSTLVDKTFWLPRERLAFQNEAPFTGYVLKASEDHLIILNDSPRIIVEKPKATLQDRDFCYPEDHKARSSKLAADSPVCP